MNFKNVINVDFETFSTDETNYHSVYAVGFTLYCSNKTDDVKIYYGMDSLDKFINNLLQMEDTILNAYNGSGFDFYFILNKMLDTQKFEIHNMVLNNGKLMNLEFSKRMTEEDENKKNKLQEAIKK